MVNTLVSWSQAESEPGVAAPIEATRRSSRLVAATALALLVSLPVIRFAQNGGRILSALGVLVGIVDIGVLPGLLLTALVGAIATGSLLEATAVGFGASFALVQVLTVAALVLHLSAQQVLLGLWGGSCALALLLFVWAPPSRWGSAGDRWERLILGLAMVLAAVLYVQSPWLPWISGEDAIHLSVIQRLAFEPRPGLRNIYAVPDFIYTYPFPGIHYFIALVSRAVDLEPVFVYQKLRALWGPIALVTLYATARLIFASERVAFASALTAAVLTLNGAFGPISSTWGQLAPVSHASDIAMTVLLPTLLLFALHFVVADTFRAATLFLCGTMALVLTLTVVHIREVVQFLVYTGAAWVVYRVIVKQRPMAFRLGVMAAASVTLVVVYLKWYQSAVGHIDAIVLQRRRMLIQAVAAMSPMEFLTPIFEHGYFMVNQQYFFYTWFPFVLVLAPLVLIAYATRPLVPFLGASLLAYAIIVFVPFVSIAYVYLTYYEILFTPVRNSLFFIYLLAGPLLLLAADAIGSLGTRTKRIAAASALIAALAVAYIFFSWAFRQPSPTLVKNMFFLTMIAGYTAALLNWRRLAGVTRPATQDSGRSVHAMLPFLGLLAAAAVISFSWANSPLKFDPASAKWTFRQYLAGMTDTTSPAYVAFKDPETSADLNLGDTVATMAAPSPELVDFGRRMLPADAVMVHNLLNLYASPVFMPQHILIWPMDGTAGMEFNARLFPKPWGALVRTAQTYQAQPFLNDKETLEERIAYMDAMGATHVLIDPMYYSRLRPLFPLWASRFKPVFDDGQRWAVLEFTPK